MRPLCASIIFRIDPLHRLGTYSASSIGNGTNRLNLVYVALSAFLIVLMDIQACACGAVERTLPCRNQSSAWASPHCSCWPAQMWSIYCALGEAERVTITDEGRLWGGQTGMRKPQAIALPYAFFMPRGQITNRGLMSFAAISRQFHQNGRQICSISST